MDMTKCYLYLNNYFFYNCNDDYDLQQYSESMYIIKCLVFYWTFKEFEDLFCGWNGNEKPSSYSINYI